ncbi:MAG: S4 domain-containing protein, partial [Fusobacteriaceae bacterium]
MRINKYLATKGVASRREIDRLIEEKLIKVNGNLAASGEKVSDSDEIEIKGVKLEKKKEEKVYFLLNKPLQVISASSDDRGRTTVVDLIDTEERIYPVGRLDYETEGAIILTNDGDLF